MVEKCHEAWRLTIRPNHQTAGACLHDTGTHAELNRIVYAKSEASGRPEGNFASQLGAGPSALRSALAVALTSAGSALTTDRLVARAGADLRRLPAEQQRRGPRWRPQLTELARLTHVSERATELVDGSPSYPLSPALNDVFLPHRLDLLEKYLARSLVLRLITSLRPIGGLLGH